MIMTDRVTNDLTRSMKEGDRLRTETLRMVRASLLEAHKKGVEVTEEMELDAVRLQAKRRRDAAEQFRAAGRTDLAEKEEAELLIIEAYLPQQLGDDEIHAIVERLVAETGASGPGDFRLVMPKAMSAMKGVADGGRIQTIVRQLLSRG